MFNNQRLFKAVGATALTLLAPMAMAAAVPVPTFLTPSSYLSFDDSPFKGIPFSVFQLENFEDGLLNTPGVSTTTPGSVLSPGAQTDSVDGDDGTIDGRGVGGRSLLSRSSGTGFTAFAFEFDATVLGALPTHVGIVWTDVGAATTPGVGTVEFQAFDILGTSLGVTTALSLGNGSADGDSADATAEDRFFGVISAGGIHRIEIRMPTSADWEVDHLQYGVSAVPLPASIWPLGLGLIALMKARRRSNG
jgi:hypothetical protein